jgi:carbamoyltransferase
MNILGISGIERAVPFKRAHWPGLEEREYRISQGHDAAAALVINGEVTAAAAEERFSRAKHTGNFPAASIRYCLAQAGLTLDAVDQLAHSFDYSPYQRAYSIDPTTARLYTEVLSKEALLAIVSRDLPGFPTERVHPVNHHLSHAASAYFTSGWDDCLVVVIDAMGEAHGMSAFHGRGGNLKKISEIPARDSIGILYSLITFHLGFDFNSDEYKIMGLAPYGDPKRFRSFFERAVQLHPDGSIRIPILRLNRTREERERYTATRKYLQEHLVKGRHPEEELTPEHRDVAAALQECLDRVMLHVCGRFGARTGLRRLALAGGVALNCTANGRLLRSGLFDEVYIQPAAGDDGSALGAALYRASLAGEVRNVRMPAPFLGPGYGAASIEAACRAFEDRIQIVRFKNLDAACTEAARLIGAGFVVAWYRGRMEFGPRALGHRSILADPGRPEMRDRINAMVKMREAFRPFAPAVSLEQAHLWFDIPPGTELPFMIATVDVREQWRAALPAITHINGSARVQTVSAKDNQEFHALLQAVGRTTGREMVLNTSFNVKGQPIVNTPWEAIETFLGTGIDFLFLENMLISRLD